jgi:hypothetical protein
VRAACQQSRVGTPQDQVRLRASILRVHTLTASGLRGSLRRVLMRAEGVTGTLSTITFGAGIVSAGLEMIRQCFQVALAVAASGTLERGVLALFGSLLWALSVIAYVPMGVMLVGAADAEGGKPVRLPDARRCAHLARLHRARQL